MILDKLPSPSPSPKHIKKILSFLIVMKYFVLGGVLALCIVLFAPSAIAAQVGIIVEFEDGSTKTECVTANEGADGKELLDASSFDIPANFARTFSEGFLSSHKN